MLFMGKCQSVITAYPEGRRQFYSTGKFHRCLVLGSHRVLFSNSETLGFEQDRRALFLRDRERITREIQEQVSLECTTGLGYTMIHCRPHCLGVGWGYSTQNPSRPPALSPRFLPSARPWSLKPKYSAPQNQQVTSCCLHLPPTLK